MNDKDQREPTKAAALAANWFFSHYLEFDSYDYMEFWDSLSDHRKDLVKSAIEDMNRYKDDGI
jgi:hypothetical protein